MKPGGSTWSRKRRRRSDHHGHRRARFQADAQALQPHSYGSEALCSGGHCHGATGHGRIRPDRAGRGVPTRVPTWLQNGSKRTSKRQAAAKNANTPAANNAERQCSEIPTNTQHFDVGYPQKSPQSGISEDHRRVRRGRKSKILFGSSGRTRTYNPSVNSRLEASECLYFQ
jgi:hypothetical protein